MIIGYDDNNKPLKLGDKVSGVIEDFCGITYFEKLEIVYKNFGYCVEEDGFIYYLSDSVELNKADGD